MVHPTIKPDTTTLAARQPNCDLTYHPNCILARRETDLVIHATYRSILIVCYVSTGSIVIPGSSCAETVYVSVAFAERQSTVDNN